MLDSKKWLNYLGEGIEEIILIGIIILNIVDFAEMLSPDWDYAKKILSWTALGYLMYKSSPTNIFFGEKHKKIDFALIITYFLLSVKIFIGYAQSTINSLREKGFSYWGQLFSVESIPQNAQTINIKYPVESLNLNSSKEIMLSTDISNNLSSLVDKLTVLPKLPLDTNNVIVNLTNNVSSSLIQVETKYSIHRWLNLLLNNPQAIYNFSIILGGIFLLFLAIYCAFKMKIRKPSMMAIFYGEKEPARGKEIFTRFLVVFLVMNFFFVVIFNLVMEWLAIAIDAPLLVMGLFFYLLIWIKHHKKFDSESFIYRVGNFGTEFYQNFILLLKSKKGVLLGVSGMLVLHLLTDVGNFLIPYTFGIHDSLYFEHLGGQHNPVFSLHDFFSEGPKSLFLSDFIATQGFADKFFLTYVYIGNIINLLLILLIPAGLWYLLFRQKEYGIPMWLPALYFSSFICLIMNPVFKITRIDSMSLIGVDIQTQSLLETAAFSFAAVFFLSFSIGILVLALSLSKKLKQYITFAGLLISLIYFANYIFLYFLDISQYYLDVIFFKFDGGKYFVAFYFIIFMLITIIFYVGGFISFLHEIVSD